MFVDHGSKRARAVGKAIAHVRKRLCSRLHEVLAAGDDEFAAGWLAFVAEVEAGFWQEESIMETMGYPGLRQHRADNACTLRALHRISPQVETGDLAPGRQALAALGDILSLHRITAGVALANAPARPGGVPARFKPRLGQRAPPGPDPSQATRLRHHRH